jgi:hypothetical protein
MKRISFLFAIAALALPAIALAKGPSEARIDGPGLGKAITITGTEEPGSPLMTFAEEAGFFPAAFSQEPNPMLPGRPKGNLGPKYTIDYTVPGPEGESFAINQDLYPYAKPYAVTYMPSGQELFRIPDGTQGGWYESPNLKRTLVAAGVPATPVSATSKSSSFFSTGRLGAVAGGAALLIAIGSVILARRRGRPGTAA